MQRHFPVRKVTRFTRLKRTFNDALVWGLAGAMLVGIIFALALFAASPYLIIIGFLRLLGVV